MKKKDRAFDSGPGKLSAADFARWYRQEILAQWEALDMEQVAKIAALVRSARDQGRQVFVMGNGGSAATASHMVTDLAKTAAAPGKPLLRALSLNDNIPFMTAIGNDLGYERLFTRQMENLVRKGDLVILISGSGNSPNVLEAARYARSVGATTVGLVGFDGGKLQSMVDEALLIRCNQYGVVEDLHMSLGHILAFYLKQSAA